MAASSSTMAFVVHRCAFLVGFLLLITQWSPIAAEVVSLTDQTFEHQTQASTGMTTGSWLVLFSIPDCPSCESLKPLIEDLGKEEDVYERGIVLGSVDCSQNQGVCFRFSATKLPVLLYLHKKQMYTYPRDEEFGSLPSMEDLKSFVLTPGDTVKGESIPDPPSALEAILNPILAIHEKNPMAGYAILGMAVMMGLTILVLLVTLAKGSGNTEKKAKTKKSKKNK